MLLLVEEEAGSRARIQALLEGAGYEVRTATSGDAALLQLRAYEPDAALLIVDALRASDAAEPRPVQPPLTPLTTREREVLERLAGGLSYEQIALTLQVALNTVRTHVRNIYRKLEVATRLEAVLTAVRAGELDRSWLFAEREA